MSVIASGLDADIEELCGRPLDGSPCAPRLTRRHLRKVPQRGLRGIHRRSDPGLLPHLILIAHDRTNDPVDGDTWTTCGLRFIPPVRFPPHVVSAKPLPVDRQEVKVGQGVGLGLLQHRRRPRTALLDHVVRRVVHGGPVAASLPRNTCKKTCPHDARAARSRSRTCNRASGGRRSTATRRPRRPRRVATRPRWES